MHHVDTTPTPSKTDRSSHTIAEPRTCQTPKDVMTAVEGVFKWRRGGSAASARSSRTALDRMTHAHRTTQPTDYTVGRPMLRREKRTI